MQQILVEVGPYVAVCQREVHLGVLVVAVDVGSCFQIPDLIWDPAAVAAGSARVVFEVTAGVASCP